MPATGGTAGLSDANVTAAVDLWSARLKQAVFFEVKTERRVVDRGAFQQICSGSFRLVAPAAPASWRGALSTPEATAELFLGQSGNKIAPIWKRLVNLPK